jgi:hypothetical protein
MGVGAVAREIGAAAAAIAMALLLAACSGGNPGAPVTVLDYTAVAPASWEPRPAGNPMRLAEFTIPVEAGAEPAEVIVYYFGEGQGGGVEANIARWTAQFSTPDGEAVAGTAVSVEGTQFRTTLVDLEGSYGRGMGMGPGREDAKPDQALSAAIVETPRGNVFLQLFGPKAAVQAARAGFLEFVKSIRS